MVFVQVPGRYNNRYEVPITYTTDQDYIECLGVCDTHYTSDDINQDLPDAANPTPKRPLDLRIPYMLRQSARSPFSGIGCADMRTDGKTPVLDHASAIIPASNGAFWVVYPFHSGTVYGDTADREKYYRYARRSVEYWAPSKSGGSEYIKITGAADDDPYYSEEIRTEAEHTESSNYTLSDASLIRGHPCGASYLNMTLPIEQFGWNTQEQIVKTVTKFGLTLIGNSKETLKRVIRDNFGSQPGIFLKDDGEYYVDVLVCYGGYHFLPIEGQSTSVRRLCRDGSVRFYVPTLVGITRDDGSVTTEDKRFEPPSFAGTPIIWQTIYPSGLYIRDITLKKVPPVTIGASLIKITSTAFRAIGGAQIKGNSPATYEYERLAGSTASAYPWTEFRVNARLCSQKKESTETAPEQNVIFLSVGITDIASRESSGNYIIPNYACFNPMSKLTFNSSSYTLRPSLHQNDAPVMYPMLYNINSSIIAYGSEWVGDITHTNNQYTLSDMFKKWFAVPVSPTYTTPVCHIPLINDQYLIQIYGAYSKMLFAYPLNISGAIGMSEGAVSIPSLDGKSLNIIGGCSSVYSEHCYNIDYTKEDDQRAANMPELNKIICVIAPPRYTDEDIHTLPLFSKIITPSVVSVKNCSCPYRLGIDTLKEDSLFSQCVQVMTYDFKETDYFVLPSTYYALNNSASPDAVLIKRIKPNENYKDSSANPSKLRIHDRMFTQVRISKIIGMPITKEDPTTYASETPYYYGRASPAKNSIGVIQDTTLQGFWLYRLGNGDKPADYYHFTIRNSAVLVDNNRVDDSLYLTDLAESPKYPSEWWGGTD